MEKPCASYIIRAEHSRDAPFLQVSVETIRDSSLDFASLGLLTFFLAKPDNWRIRIDALAKERGVNRATMYRAIDKLISAGYVTRDTVRVRAPDGTFRTESVYLVFETLRLREAIKPRKEVARTDEYQGQVVPF